MNYAELHAWSAFTFQQAGSQPEELIRRGQVLKLDAVALTDQNGLYGSVRFAKAADEGVAADGTTARPAAICGAEFALVDGSPIVLLCADAEGYRNLTRHISRAQLAGRKNAPRPTNITELAGATDGLIALSGGNDSRIAQALLAGDMSAAENYALELRDVFPGAAYLEVQHHLRPRDTTIVHAMVSLGARLNMPIVATNGVRYAEAADALTSDVLQCVRRGISLDEAFANGSLENNAERHLKSATRMARLFSPFPQAIQTTLEIAERCTFRLRKQDAQFPDARVPQGKTIHQYLCELVAAGASDRYNQLIPARVQGQINHELAIIEKLDLSGYFITVWEIVQAARAMDILCQGRGSAANSVVCYVLQITSIDPVASELLFERFLSEDRRELPDIDIDFAHHDREKIIQWVYERWGREYVAMAAEVITYRPRSAIRDVGKALGLHLDQVEAIARAYDAGESFSSQASTQSRLAAPTHDAAAAQPAAPIDDATAQQLLAICSRIDGFPRHMGIHSGGMVITRDPLISVAPIEYATMPGRTIVQWDKDDLAEVGLIKIDLLGLGILSLLRDAFAQIQTRDAMDPAKSVVALHRLPPDDQATYAMLQRGDAIGVFQVESRAQMTMLPRLRPACFYDLVMQVAIIRPGPIQGQMIHPFLRRRAGLEKVAYPHPRLEPILRRTLGVPLFQEQGMRMAIEAAGFTAGEADLLRRAMGNKRSRERMREIYPRLISGMVANGIDAQAADALYNMLQGFADYGFPESHAASFALLTYASAYLKCHEPAIFTAALLNAQPMGFYSTEVILNDARRSGVRTAPIAVNASRWWSFVEENGQLRLGFHLIRGLGQPDPPAARELDALLGRPFPNLAAFVADTPFTSANFEQIAAADAFAPWHTSRREALWAVAGAIEQQARGPLGQAMPTSDAPVQFAGLTPFETTRMDLWSTGTSVTHPIMHARPQLHALRARTVLDILAAPHGAQCRVGGLVTTRQRPATAKGVVFLTLEDETGLLNIIVKPALYEKFRRIIRQSPTLLIDGRVQRDNTIVHVLLTSTRALDLNGGANGVRARNFH